MIDKKTASLWHEDKSIEDAAPGDNEPTVAPKPTVYLSDQSTCVVLSALSEDHPEAQNYFMDLVSLRITGKPDSSGNTLTILRNILEKAGVQVVIE